MPFRLSLEGLSPFKPNNSLVHLMWHILALQMQNQTIIPFTGILLYLRTAYWQAAQLRQNYFCQGQQDQAFQSIAKLAEKQTGQRAFQVKCIMDSWNGFHEAWEWFLQVEKYNRLK